MLRGMLATLLVAVTIVLGTPSATSAAPAPGACGQGSWVAGTVELCDGELVYRDYIYDSFGARPAIPGLTLPQIIEELQFQSIPDFDAYGGLPPAGGEKDQNQTDLVALRVRIDGGQVHVSAELNTMFVPDAAIVAIAIDTDDNSATGGGTWPGIDVASAGWDEEHVFTAGDPSSNLVEGQFAQPAGSTWRLWAVVAKPDGTPMNVAFRGVDEAGFWWEDNQADALAAGDITDMSTEVAIADLAGGATQQAEVPPGAVRQRVYISPYPLGEGIDDDGVPGPGFTPGSPGESVSQAFTLLGRYQPYGFWEPVGAGPHGLQLALHGLAENHAARLYLPGTPHNFGPVMGNGPNRIIATPLGRGWKGWYSSYSERDVLDVLADVEANYDVDRDRVLLSGYSMGGYGAMRIAALHPGRFTSVVNWVGFAGDVFNGTPFGGQFLGSGSGGGADVNVTDLVGSLRHTPMYALYAGADELVHVQTAIELRTRLSELAVPSIFYLHPTAEHLTFALFDDWEKETAVSADDALVRDPSHITFRTDRKLFYEDVGLVPDSAYWVSSIVPAADGYADVDAISLGCGGNAEPVTTEVSGSGPDPVPWQSNEVRVTGVEHRAEADRLELVLRNVASLHIDLERACLSPDADIAVTSDQPVTVSLSTGETLSFEPETLPRTGGDSADTAPLLLALASALALGRQVLRRVAVAVTTT